VSYIATIITVLWR